MTDSFVTQCPHCQTSFRVSHAQLSVARGVVRCGSCLQVFNAARQLLEQRAGKDTPAPPAAAAAPEPEAPPVQRAISQKQWSATELDLDNLDLDEELAKLEQREIQPAKTFGQERAPREDSLSARREQPDGEEEHWPDSLFSQAPGSGDELDEHPGQAAQAPADRGKPGRTEPSLSFSLDDLEDEPKVPSLHLDDDLEPTPLVVDDHPEDEPPVSPAPRGKRGRHEAESPEATLRDLEDDPLQLDWQKRRSPWGRRLLWSLLILLAAAGLAGQYIAYHFDELARQDQYRPWFQQLCPQLGCSVPSKVDIDRIKSSNLVVRSHPDFSGALVVDAIIYNRAPFSQPFPLLELRFADLNGHLIASRRFKPGEYVKGELEGVAEMPPQTPIHIALDILDPGPKAVNYSLSFHSPE
ncbi:DUF3426 domain-containing protein [Pseudomonas chlororaphis]|uniref:Zinc finger/thioredoxin putative domain-containing protein n=1 Tax=Pseudomonas chlororaphis TaxID=587753 RepID=A0A0D5Y768_9PSED|nr:DUF3426 domain-containing protein [Pseudomonas chlororaphis]AKA26869.1 hypothetical protein PCL1606_54240 [Pseudomonas chlororaphis]MCB2252098.1 zinc-ribbon domain-containing protein [Pseudomonas chlororaphis]